LQVEYHPNSQPLDLVFIPPFVTTGHPVGQHFGVGGQWVQGGTLSAKPAWSNFNKSYTFAKVVGVAEKMNHVQPRLFTAPIPNTL
jgi:hypothetical protein